ncbi:hypothetical protein L2E82_49273 [Cichorium intybus]|uniref:Uncharacterized protein n=1 Tax=Cichorium intybus TaxID=13427 RepID=A0ACB8Z0G4_CICIN|nr:hypothetical protein L2E82_49273 [Cichorium intybus]
MMMLVAAFFPRQSSSTFAAFLTTPLAFDEPSRIVIASTIRRSAYWPLVVILLKRNNLLEYEDNATIHRRSEDESDEMINLIVRFIIYIFLIGIFLLTSTKDCYIALLLSEVKGKDITELIATGREKLASIPSGGGGGVAVDVAADGGGALAAAGPKKDKKVEQKEESDDVSSCFHIVDIKFNIFE